MRSRPENDLLYLLRMLESSEKILLYSHPFTNAEDFFNANDQKDFNASLNLLAQIGEQANKLSAELIKKYTKPDWIQWKGFRNRIVHDYTGIDLYLTFDIIKTNIPLMKLLLTDIIKAELTAGTFDKKEFEVAKTSPYLRHIDFTIFYL